MSNTRKGTVVIKEKIAKGIISKYYIYGGGLKGVPGIYGYSVKQKLNKEYHKGDEVNYWITYVGKKNATDEVMVFEIVEE